MSDENDLSNFSMLDLFRTEVENQVAILNDGLLALEKDPSAAKVLETLMRAAHSLKGAARIVQIDPAVKVAHALEDCFVAAQKGTIVLKPEKMDVVLKGIDFITQIGNLKEQDLDKWITDHSTETESLVAQILRLATTQPEQQQAAQPAASVAEGSSVKDSEPRTVRVRAENLNRLLAYAAENSIAATTLEKFTETLRLIKNQQRDLTASMSQWSETLDQSTGGTLPEQVTAQSVRIHQELSDCYAELERFSRRTVYLTKKLYGEVLDSRMRAFREVVEALPRMVRDVSRQLGKKVKFDVRGKQTKVDRDILERLEAPLNHLLRNALDHGIETPSERVASGKSEEASLVLEASHKGGMLHIQVADDGRGVDFDRLRKKLVAKGLITSDMAGVLSEEELLEFLFLPGFSTVDQVTELSGRGVGLDIVYNMVREVGGQIQSHSQPNQGMSVHLQLPLTLSILRTLLVEISGETYALPLARIDKTMLATSEELVKQDHGYRLRWNDQWIPAMHAHRVLYLLETEYEDPFPVIVMNHAGNPMALVVNRFHVQKDLVVRPLDARLGKVKNIHAASVLEDGSPVLILDVQDLLRSMDQMLAKASQTTDSTTESKRILVVEDSMTVRDFEQKILTGQGFIVDLAVDGMDGWHALKSASYNIVITDLDMPRMNGLELTKKIRADSKLKDLPVLMVSYKERKEDREAALRAGANRFLSKNSFHDESFLRAVRELASDL